MSNRKMLLKISDLLIKTGIAVLICLAGGLPFCRAAGEEAVATVSLRIPSAVEVPGPKIHLSDLGVVEGSADPVLTAEIGRVDLGMAPVPGFERRLTRDYLEFILKQHRLNTKILLNMEPAVIIRVEATSISAVEIQKNVENLLCEKNSDYLSRKVNIINLPSEIWLEKGVYRVEVSSVGKIPEFGNGVFRIEIFGSSGKKKSLNLGAKISVTANVFEAKRTIGPKEPLTEDDFTVKARELSSGREIFGTFPIGCRMAGTINPGEILEKPKVEAVPAVVKDGQVAVIVRVDGVEITVKAIARMDAAIGDEIQLYNPVSKKIFKGRVTGKNVAEVSVL